MNQCKKKKIVIVGAGPGGLTAAMILAFRGFQVEVFEVQDRVGGRNGRLKLGDYKFDLGPTFLLQRFTLEEMFEEVDLNVEELLDFVKLNPMYRLWFEGFELDCTTDLEEMTSRVEKAFPSNGQGVKSFMGEQEKKFKRIFPVLQNRYLKYSDFARNDVLKAIPYLLKRKSLFDELGRYFNSDELKLAFTFQSKYLGMSPWKCPSIFTILPYIEYKYGVEHVMGGLNRISEVMADTVKAFGGKIHLGQGVKKVLKDGREVKGLELENGEKVEADEVIINADFAYAAESLLSENGDLKKWSKGTLNRKKYSCSTFMIYAGVKKEFEVPHHNILFAKDYKRNVAEIMFNKKPSEDMSIYVHNPSRIDKSLAPEGKSSMYILVPTINCEKGYDWSSQAQSYREKVLAVIERRMGMQGLKDNIEVEKVITPADWKSDFNVYRGAVFNLAHVINQMLIWRPHNRFEELDNLYLVGGGTHPGSGLPTIYESGRISANLICEKYGVHYEKPDTVNTKL